DGDVVLHEALDVGAAEDAHQVVVEREVEARGARVALTAGAAAELVVDAAGLVALGAQDEETAELLDLLALGAAALVPLGDGFLVLLLVLGEGGLDLGPAALGRVADLLAGEGLVVAAEDDVRAPAGHVGGDGHGALAAGERDDV